jgi:hypothetical protein
VNRSARLNARQATPLNQAAASRDDSFRVAARLPASRPFLEKFRAPSHMSRGLRLEGTYIVANGFAKDAGPSADDGAGALPPTAWLIPAQYRGEHRHAAFRTVAADPVSQPLGQSRTCDVWRNRIETLEDQCVHRAAEPDSARGQHDPEHQRVHADEGRDHGRTCSWIHEHQDTKRK